MRAASSQHDRAADAEISERGTRELWSAASWSAAFTPCGFSISATREVKAAFSAAALQCPGRSCYPKRAIAPSGMPHCHFYGMHFAWDRLLS
jgi:hypothetical protein